MNDYEQLSVEEQVSVYNKAFTFLHDHADYVHNLFTKYTPSVEPSVSDLFRPELWKGIHWVWFLKTESQWLIKSKLFPNVEH